MSLETYNYNNSYGSLSNYQSGLQQTQVGEGLNYKQLLFLLQEQQKQSLAGQFFDAIQKNMTQNYPKQYNSKRLVRQNLEPEGFQQYTCNQVPQEVQSPLSVSQWLSNESFENRSNMTQSSVNTLTYLNLYKLRQSMIRRPIRQQESLQDNIKRTIYVSEIDPQITLQQLEAVFSNYGQIKDTRLCGDPNSTTKFAFIEFEDQKSLYQAIKASGLVIGSKEIKIMPSKTAIQPLNKQFIPQTPEEKDRVLRTVYITNIDRLVKEQEIKNLFENICGQITALRLLGDNQHFTCICFVEFMSEAQAKIALNCNGFILGSLPLRISPSKTPVQKKDK